jgi:hypothetical protein
MIFPEFIGIIYYIFNAVPFRNRERITFDHLVSMKKLNEKAVVRVMRDGQELELSIILRPVSFIYIPNYSVLCYANQIIHINREFILQFLLSNTNDLLHVYSHHIDLALDILLCLVLVHCMLSDKFCLLYFTVLLCLQLLRLFVIKFPFG